MLDAIGKRVIVKVLSQDDTSSSVIMRADTQMARFKGEIISVGSEAKKLEPKLEPGKIVLYYKQPDFKFNGETIAEFNYEHLIGIIEE